MAKTVQPPLYKVPKSIYDYYAHWCTDPKELTRVGMLPVSMGCDGADSLELKRAVAANIHTPINALQKLLRHGGTIASKVIENPSIKEKQIMDVLCCGTGKYVMVHLSDPSSCFALFNRFGESKIVLWYLYQMCTMYNELVALELLSSIIQSKFCPEDVKIDYFSREDLCGST